MGQVGVLLETIGSLPKGFKSLNPGFFADMVEEAVASIFH